MTEAPTSPSMSILDALDVRLRARIREHMEERTFEPGAFIIERGTRGTSLYVVRSGRVHVRVPDADGKLRFETHLGAGDVFGEMALLTGEPRSADVVVDASGPATCLALPKDALDALIDENPSMAGVLTRLLDERVIESRLLERIGPYHLVGLIGRGEMASVFEGYHTVLRRPVAVKMLSHALVRRPGFLERFRAEAQTLAALRHPGVVRVYDACEGFGTWFIVMERLEGADLREHIETHGTLSFAEARRVVRCIADALHHAHEQGVIHRDVKPSNVFRDEAGCLKLVDFGVATALGTDESRDIMGTPAYAAPEVVTGGRVDARTDIYALGMLAWTLLAGSAAFDNADPTVTCALQVGAPLPDPPDVMDDIPEDLETFIRRATQKDPDDRFASARDVLDHFARSTGEASEGGREQAVLRISWPSSGAEQAHHALNSVQALLWAYEALSVELEGGPATQAGPPG